MTIDWVDASLGPEGFWWRRVLTRTDHWCVQAGLVGVTSRDNTLVCLEDGWKIAKAEGPAPCYSKYIYIFVDVLIVMLTTEMFCQHFTVGIFQTKG